MERLPHSPRLESWAWLLPAVVALIALLINPIGYLGGSGDDFRYLQAARCWVAEGQPCIPSDHWATRWPVIALMAVAMRWLGESRATVGLGALMAWIAAIVLIGWLGRLWIDRRGGLIAASMLAATPGFTQAALQPGVDTTELALQLAALVAATIAFRSQHRLPAVMAGILAAVAVQARDTSILFCAAAVLAWLLIDRERRRILLWALAGFAAAMAIEIFIYWWTTGEPLHRYALAMNHVGIPSEELPAGFNRAQSPFFNGAYIAAWRREAGILWWWPLDPWLNLLASPRLGFVLIGAAVLAITLGKMVDRPVRRRIAIASGLSLMMALLLVYGLAVDPKARMFMVLAANAALIIGACVSAATRAGRGLVPLVMVGLMIGFGMFTLSRITTIREFETLAERWINANPDLLSVNREASKTLTLVPGIRALPLDAASRPYRLAGGNEPCTSYGGGIVEQSAIVGAGQLCLIDVRGAH